MKQTNNLDHLKISSMKTKPSAGKAGWEKEALELFEEVYTFLFIRFLYGIRPAKYTNKVLVLQKKWIDFLASELAEEREKTEGRWRVDREKIAGEIEGMKDDGKCLKGGKHEMTKFPDAYCKKCRADSFGIVRWNAALTEAAKKVRREFRSSNECEIIERRWNERERQTKTDYQNYP